MAKRERNKRAARKARQQERERVELARAAAASGEASKKDSRSSKNARASKTKQKKPVVAKADRKGIQKVTGYFGDVRSEMKKVTWPSRTELRNYSVAVIATLIVFGIAIWLFDTGIVAGLVAFTGLRG